MKNVHILKAFYQSLTKLIIMLQDNFNLYQLARTCLINQKVGRSDDKNLIYLEGLIKIAVFCLLN